MQKRTAEILIDRAMQGAQSMSAEGNAYDAVGEASTPGVLYDAPDDTILDDYNPKLLTASNRIHLATPEELHMVLGTYNETRVGGRISQDYIDNQVEHEGQHGDVARELGFQAVYYSLTIHDFVLQPDGRASISWFVATEAINPSRPIRKIGLAALRTAPSTPSRGDKKALEALGYKGGPLEVAQRIERYNTTASDPVPLPYFSR